MNCFIDTHSHIDMDEFKDNIPEILAKCNDVGVTKIIIPGVNVEDTPRIIDLIDKYDNLYALVGMHPEEAAKWDSNSYVYFKNIAMHPKVLGIGEIGLDYYWDRSTAKLQQEIFKLQIELAKEIHKPICVHDREAHADTMNILKETNAIEAGVVLHCFSGSVEFLEECIKEGFYISLGGVTTFKNAKKPQEIAKHVPIDRLMLETDAPYLTPTPHRGEINYPYYVPIIAEYIANLKSVTVDELAQNTYNNSIRFFNIV